ncbi:MAG: sugar phosphate isomerase/epimerase [Planctomycetia bacterium]|nr:sugar phosphate isomerase/epimerase [Planctomycetia bacterium]
MTPASATTSSRPASPSAPPHTLHVGCGEWGFRNLSMREHFEIAASFGFRDLEFGIGGGQVGRLPEEPSAADIQAFRSLAESSGMATPGCCIENDFTQSDEAAHAAAVEKALAQSRAAAACGAQQVRFFAGFTPYAEMTDAIWSRLIDSLVACDRELEKLGLTIAIETHGAIRWNSDGSATHVHTATTHREGLDRLLTDLPERIGFNYDPGNIRAAEPGDTRYAVDLLSGRITYCHLKDWVRTGQGWAAAAVGDAADGIDWAELLPKTGYTGTYLIEYEPLSDTRAGIDRSLAHLRAVGFSC